MSSVQSPLDRLATTLAEEACRHPWGQPAHAVAVRGSLEAATFELLMRPLDGHPAGALLDIEPEDSWSAAGLITEGSAVDLDDPAGGRRQRARTVLVIDRHGQAAGSARFEDGSTIEEPPSEGLVVDALRRVLDQPTPPPPCSTADYFSSVWLMTVLRQAAGGQRHLTWRTVASLHPAVKLRAGGTRSAPRDLPDAVAWLHAWADWERLHGIATRHGWPYTGLTPERAARLDVGAFARQALAVVEPADALLPCIQDLLAPSASRRVRAAVNGSW